MKYRARQQALWARRLAGVCAARWRCRCRIRGAFAAIFLTTSGCWRGGEQLLRAGDEFGADVVVDHGVALVGAAVAGLAVKCTSACAGAEPGQCQMARPYREEAFLPACWFVLGELLSTVRSARCSASSASAMRMATSKIEPGGGEGHGRADEVGDGEFRRGSLAAGLFAFADVARGIDGEPGGEV